MKTIYIISFAIGILLGLCLASTSDKLGEIGFRIWLWWNERKKK